MKAAKKARKARKAREEALGSPAAALGSPEDSEVQEDSDDTEASDDNEAHPEPRSPSPLQEVPAVLQPLVQPMLSFPARSFPLPIAELNGLSITSERGKTINRHKSQSPFNLHMYVTFKWRVRLDTHLLCCHLIHMPCSR